MLINLQLNPKKVRQATRKAKEEMEERTMMTNLTNLKNELKPKRKRMKYHLSESRTKVKATKR